MGHDALDPASTDWLRHVLTVTGPAKDIDAFQKAAAGAGAIPWAYPDLELLEEDRFARLLHPPDGSPGLSLTGARSLAGQLRTAMEANQRQAVALAGHSRACPFDLHALLPVPDRVLQLGPDDAESLAWLREAWGVVRPLRHVRLRVANADRRLRRSGRLEYEFWSADWTPWAAIRALRRGFSTLVLDIRPDYGGE
jgi:hypothetical protein